MLKIIQKDEGKFVVVKNIYLILFHYFNTMKTFKLLFVSALIVFSSCENFTWFQSEDTVKKEIQGTWERQFLSVNEITYFHEYWDFKDGKVHVFSHDLTPYDPACTHMQNYCDEGYPDLIRTDGNDTIILDSGNYAIDAKIDKVFLNTTELTAIDENNYNHKWTIVDIDNSILYIAADKTDLTGIVQREFNKQK